MGRSRIIFVGNEVITDDAVHVFSCTCVGILLVFISCPTNVAHSVATAPVVAESSETCVIFTQLLPTLPQVFVGNSEQTFRDKNDRIGRRMHPRWGTKSVIEIQGVILLQTWSSLS